MLPPKAEPPDKRAASHKAQGRGERQLRQANVDDPWQGKMEPTTDAHGENDANHKAARHKQRTEPSHAFKVSHALVIVTIAHDHRIGANASTLLVSTRNAFHLPIDSRAADRR